MKLVIPREALLKSLSLVAGVVERRQTMAILSNVLLDVKGQLLSVTGTDLEIEVTSRVTLDDGSATDDFQITLPAKKLLDICKALPDGCEIKIDVTDESKVVVSSGRSRFTLASLPADEFPNVDEGEASAEFTLLQGEFKRLLDRTAFAMAQQDVRYYLNGMLWELEPNQLRVVSTDGHRLALCELKNAEVNIDGKQQIIVPRKGIIELARSLQSPDDSVQVFFGHNHLRVVTESFTFISKLVDGKFPDYQRVLPRGGNKVVIGSRIALKEAFSRAAILSNEKYRGVRLLLAEGALTIQANNPEQEEAEDTVAVEYMGDGLEIGFNVNYLLDALSVLSGESVKLTLSDSNSSALVEETGDSDSLYVIMPMRL
ncbi:Beta sliding clamp [BD1-7 clade bacterium]|uniref:Beta sliding clamp n=1 Tax=BD1-7 clade bacterium TaxID=2029982 RepID=A0A5S9QG24_9GAMM|nr:Beta sliding clamp [BD1-7 clade bacterium]